MTNLEQKLIKIFTKYNEALSKEQLEVLFESSVDEILESLMEKKIVHRSHHGIGKYQLTSNALIEGNVVAIDEDYFIVAPFDERNIFVPKTERKKLNVGDTVLVRAIYEIDGKCIGQLQKKINLKKENLVGVPKKRADEYYVTYKGTEYKINMTHQKKEIENKVVKFKLLKKKAYQYTYAEVIRIIGEKTDIGIQNSIVLHRLGIADKFPKSVQIEVKDFPKEITKRDLFARKDCRDHTVVTIDDKDTKDMDDAIEVTKLENGHFKLIVHIADVAHYVKRDTKLWNEVLKRGTSVYLSDRVIPMLPKELSNHLCSLMEGVDRLVMSCELEFDEIGNVVSKQVYESVIRSKKKMTYDEVNQVFQNQVPEGYEPYVDTLYDMKELSHLIRFKMIKDGYLRFDLPETRMKAYDGEPLHIQLRSRSEAEDMIENFMIIANEEVAKFLLEKNALSIYRVLERPKMQKMLKVLRELELAGYQLNVHVPETITGEFMQSLLGQIEKTKDKVLHEHLVHTMNRAEYSLEEMMHFGIGSIYTHFTSPIRRINDLCIHMLLKNHIKQIEFGDMDEEMLREFLLDVATRATKTERIANVAENTDKKLCEVSYMLEHKDQNYYARIIQMTGQYIVVQLDDNLITGVIYTKQYSYLKYDATHQQLIDHQHDKVYKLGDYFTVKLSQNSYQLSLFDLSFQPIDRNQKLIEFSIIGMGKLEKGRQKVYK